MLRSNVQSLVLSPSNVESLPFADEPGDEDEQLDEEAAEKEKLKVTLSTK